MKIKVFKEIVVKLNIVISCISHMCNRETGLSVMISKHLNEDELTSSTL